MKPLLAVSLVLALFVVVPVACHAQSGSVKGMDAGKKAEGAVHRGVGVVKKVDTARSAVTLDHEAIKSLNWSAMTMSFSVKDRKLLDNLQTGRKVEFEFVQQGRDNVITSIK